MRKYKEWDGLYQGRADSLPEGTVVTLGAFGNFSFKGATHQAVHVSVQGLCGDNYYLLVEEAGLSEYCSQ